MRKVSGNQASHSAWNELIKGPFGMANKFSVCEPSGFGTLNLAEWLIFIFIIKRWKGWTNSKRRKEKNTRTQTAKEEMRRLKKITKWPAQMPANGFTRGSGWRKICWKHAHFYMVYMLHGSHMSCIMSGIGSGRWAVDGGGVRKEAWAVPNKYN